MTRMPTQEALTKTEFARRAGCERKQVYRAIESGKLVENADGDLDPAQLETPWRRKKRRYVLTDEVAVIPEVGTVVSTAPDEARPSAGEPVMDIRASLALKEHFQGKLKELEFHDRAKATIHIDAARKVLFDEARAGRDAWLNFVPKNAALIAADLGLEAGRVAEVLTGYVHRQLAALGNPRGDFSQD